MASVLAEGVVSADSAEGAASAPAEAAQVAAGSKAMLYAAA